MTDWEISRIPRSEHFLILLYMYVYCLIHFYPVQCLSRQNCSENKIHFTIQSCRPSFNGSDFHHNAVILIPCVISFIFRCSPSLMSLGFLLFFPFFYLFDSVSFVFAFPCFFVPFKHSAAELLLMSNSIKLSSLKLIF